MALNGFARSEKNKNINDCYGEYELYKNSKRTMQWTLYHLQVLII